MTQLLRTGSQGSAVKAVQDVLNHHIRRGWPPLVVDGIFGAMTDARVREFQRSNALAVDGIVGPVTSAKLFETAQVEAAIFVMPRLRLTPPSLPGSGRGRPAPFGKQPSLSPPLQLSIPGFGPLTTPPGCGTGLQPLWLGPSFALRQASTTGLPPLQGQAFVFRLSVLVPQRNDPLDPHVRSYQNTVALIRSTQLGSQAEDLLVSFVPKPITVFTPPTPGFGWGAAPLFDPFDPTGFGVKGNARFTFELASGRNGLPTVVFGAWGDGRAFLNFETHRGEARPRLELQGNVFFGASGVF